MVCTEDGCQAPAEFRIRLMNDPDGQYCEQHARERTAIWNGMGYPSPAFTRLSDGKAVRWEAQ